MIAAWCSKTKSEEKSMKKLLSLILLGILLLPIEPAMAAKKSVRKKASQKTTQSTKIVDKHSYYKGLTREQATKADKIAEAIAKSLLSKKELATDFERVNAAARIVEGYCKRGMYGDDENRYYRSPYGVFISGNYTCAGATRALGRILDFMGYEWEHANENQWTHQWCILKMDGKTAFADGQGGFAGYGEYDAMKGIGIRYGIYDFEKE